MANDRAFVERVSRLLADEGVAATLVGGWADELAGRIAPRPHSDVDFACAATEAGRVDAMLARLELAEVHAKRRRTKRAFVLDGVLVELHLADDRTGRGDESSHARPRV